MKLKKKYKRILITILVIALLVILSIAIVKLVKGSSSKEPEEVKIVSKIDKYGYNLKENKPKVYKDMFEELKTILNTDKVNEEEYAKKITEMFIYDFYSLNDKMAKTDIGGVDFVYKDILDNYLQNAQDTYYKYVESNIYNNRKQTLPEVTNIVVGDVTQKPFAYGDKTDEKAYEIKATWDYTNTAFSKYQKSATLIFIHDDFKLSLVELK